jgi:Ca-activated chloride channel family protein
VLAATVWMLVRALRRAPGGALTGAGPVIWALRVLLVLACGALLLRPGVPGGHVRTLASATDVVIAIDTTASMVAEDWDGVKNGSAGNADSTRMAGVRQDVQRIAEAYPGARFALITFDANAVLRLPLTTDTGALVSAVEVLQPG